MVWRREVAEDATQEILLKAVTHLGGFENRSKFSTWPYRIAVTDHGQISGLNEGGYCPPGCTGRMKR